MSAIPLLETWRATGREVAVVGLGKSGVAASLLLRDHALPVYASDTGTGGAYDAWAGTLRAAGAEVQLGGHDLDRIGRAAAVVVAPGVPPDVPPLAAARRAGVSIYAEVDLGFLALGGTRCHHDRGCPGDSIEIVPAELDVRAGAPESPGPGVVRAARPGVRGVYRKRMVAEEERGRDPTLPQSHHGDLSSRRPPAFQQRNGTHLSEP